MNIINGIVITSRWQGVRWSPPCRTRSFFFFMLQVTKAFGTYIFETGDVVCTHRSTILPWEVWDADLTLATSRPNLNISRGCKAQSKHSPLLFKSRVFHLVLRETHRGTRYWLPLMLGKFKFWSNTGQQRRSGVRAGERSPAGTKTSRSIKLYVAKQDVMPRRTKIAKNEPPPACGIVEELGDTAAERGPRSWAECDAPLPPPPPLFQDKTSFIVRTHTLPFLPSLNPDLGLTRGRGRRGADLMATQGAPSDEIGQSASLTIVRNSGVGRAELATSAQPKAGRSSSTPLAPPRLDRVPIYFRQTVQPERDPT